MMKTAIAIVAIAVLTMSPPAGAQVSERTSPHVRNDCRLAAQVLTSGRPHPHRIWALDHIRRCEESGGGVLATLWTAPDEEELERLYWLSAGLLDAGLLEAVRAAAADPSNPTIVRLTAMSVLPTYVRPTIHASIESLTPPEDEFARVRMIGYVSHRGQMTSPDPPEAGFETSMLAFLSELEDSDPDATVRYAAGRLRSILSLFVEEPTG